MLFGVVLDIPGGASVVLDIPEGASVVSFDGGRVVGMMSKGMRSGTGEKPLRHGHISPTYQPGVSRGVQEYKHTVAWQRKHNMTHGRKEHLVQHYKGRHDKGESQTRCGKAQCSMARKGREGGEAAVA